MIKAIGFVGASSVFNAGLLVLAWALLGSTELNLPDIGNALDYLAAGLAIWFIGSILNTDDRVDS